MANGSIAVVGASEEQYEHIKQCLADWRCEEAVLKDEGNEISSIPVTALLVILFALKKKGHHGYMFPNQESPPDCCYTNTSCY